MQLPSPLGQSPALSVPSSTNPQFVPGAISIRSQGSIAAADALATARGVAMLVDVPVTIPDTMTLSCPRLIFSTGGSLVLNYDKTGLVLATLTLNVGSVDSAKDQQIFSGVGNYRFSSTGQTEFWVGWFGVKANLMTVDPGYAFAEANRQAYQKLIDSLPGANDSGPGAADRMNQPKSVRFEGKAYAISSLVNPITVWNRHITFVPGVIGSQSSAGTVIMWYSNPNDGGYCYKPLYHLVGNPGTAPLFQNVTGEIAWAPGFKHEAYPTTAGVGDPIAKPNNPLIQCGGLNSGDGLYTAAGASPITGITLDKMEVGDVYCLFRSTYCSGLKVNDCLVDGAYWFGLFMHGAQETKITNCTGNGIAFWAFGGNPTGVVLNADGTQIGPIHTTTISHYQHNESQIGYGGYPGGYGGIVQILNDANNPVQKWYMDEINAIELGDMQHAVYGNTKSAVIYFENASDVYWNDCKFYEWTPGATFRPKSPGQIGNGTVTGLQRLATSQTGVYTATCTATAPNSGTFQVKDPVGTVLGNVTVGGAAFAVQLSFSIVDGTIDFAVGDRFDLYVMRFTNLVHVTAGDRIYGNDNCRWELEYTGRKFDIPSSAKHVGCHDDVRDVNRGGQMANNTTFTFPNVQVARITVFETALNGDGAEYLVSTLNGLTKLITQIGTNYGIVPGAAGSYNMYVAANIVTFQNLIGLTASFRFKVVPVDEGFC